MASRIEDYALIGDLQTAALVGLNGSIDWLCTPRFDSPACFASLVGTQENGYWLLAPAAEAQSTRRYRTNTLVLETRFETAGGAVTVVDCMPVSQDGDQTRIVRLVRGESGSVRMHMEIAIRFDYGKTVPWVRRRDYGLNALSGPNAIELHTPVPMEGRDFRTYADFDVAAGEVVPFVLSYHGSLDPPAMPEDGEALCNGTEAWWQRWSATYTQECPWSDAVLRSLITLKALTHLSTGGIIAAPTTSLPETVGGRRNWDYRYCWLRDATFTLYALLTSGLMEEARQWRDWLLRAAAGKPSQMQTLYGAAGERLLPEFEVGWLAGYQGSKPVRVGNQAHRQLQLDVYGEIMDVLHVSRRSGLADTAELWSLQKELMDFLESGWRKVDNGIWEVRGRRRHFTHSKVMSWVAIDRAVKAIEGHGAEGPLDKWRQLRATIHEEVCRRGFDSDRNAFVQTYGSDALDASLLMIPFVGFLPATDPRCVGTVRAIETELMREGFVERYKPQPEVEGFAGGREGVFLPCTFWLADNYALMGENDKAVELFERLLAVRNDVGLLSEEYDPESKRLLGNFPQAFTHVSLVNTAHNLTAFAATSPAEHRAKA